MEGRNSELEPWWSVSKQGDSVLAPFLLLTICSRDVNHGDELILECWHMGSKGTVAADVLA